MLMFNFLKRIKLSNAKNWVKIIEFLKLVNV